MSKKDYYNILGVSSSANDTDIKRAYRDLAKKYHPDINKGNEEAEEKFKEISEAYSVISDPQKRRQYDQSKRVVDLDDPFGVGFDFNIGGINIRFGGSRDFTDFDLGFVGFRDGFGQAYNARHSTVRRKSSNINITVPLTLEELFKTKIQKKIIFDRHQPCSSCKGTGGNNKVTCSVCGGEGYVKKESKYNIFRNIVEREKCSLCQGKGYIIDSSCLVCEGQGILVTESTIIVTLPDDVHDGKVLKVSGQGNASGDKDVQNGDLIIRIRIDKHPIFRRRGQYDLLMTLPIKVSTLLLGGDVEVQTINNGVKKIRVNREMNLNDSIVMEEEGLPIGRDKLRFGRLFLKPIIDVPESLTREQKNKVKELAKCGL